ncbi:MAG: hypothetical protein WEA76_08535 [Acidimicrobiia bacterium]
MKMNRIGFVLGLSLGLVMATSLAFAQEGEPAQPDTGPPVFEEGNFPPDNPGELPELGSDEDETGPPPFLAHPDWARGTPGPPPWAGQEDGDPPPMLNPAYAGWKIGTPGPPPWAGHDDPDGEGNDDTAT